MRSNDIQLSYRSSAIEGATGIGLVIALYDRLVSDIRAAAAAIRADDIEGRCRELNHASWIVGQLEDWIDKDNGGELAQNLSDLYAYLRARFTQAAVEKSASMLEEQIELLSQVRGAWQQRDSGPATQPPTLTNPQSHYAASPSLQVERTVFSQSA